MTPHERTDAQIAIALRDWLERGVEALPDGMDLPAPVRDQIITQLPTTPQRRRWWSGRWSTRGRRALRSDDVPGDTESRRSRRMNGFAALLAAGAIGGAAVLAGVSQQDQGGRTIVVAQDGSGDAITITDGVALAVDGDTVLIRAGVYGESVTITTDITVTADGEVVVEAPEDGPRAEDVRVNGGYGLALTDMSGSVDGLTLRGLTSRLVISGGSPRLSRLLMEQVDKPYDGSTNAPQSAVHITDQSTATITDSRFVDSGAIGIFDDSSPILERNVLTGGSHIWISDDRGLDSRPVIRDNVIEGVLLRAIAAWSVTNAIIEGNRISAGRTGIDILNSGSPTIRGNDVSGASVGISVAGGSSGVIEGNDVHDNLVGIIVAASVTVDGNTMRANQTTGVAVAGGADPTITDNVIEANGNGLTVGPGSTPTMTGNRFCGNAEDFKAEPPAPLPPGNEVCPNGLAPSPSAGS